MDRGVGSLFNVAVVVPRALVLQKSAGTYEHNQCEKYSVAANLASIKTMNRQPK